MPVVFRYKGIRFLFYSNEGNPREPIHIHARGNGNDAKLWLYPAVGLAYSDGFSRQEQLELIRIVEQHKGEIERAWNEYFSEESSF